MNNEYTIVCKMPTEYFSLNKKVIIITGGAGLLGEQYAKIIAKANGTPIILDLNKKKSKKICEKLNNLHSCNAQYFVCDITNEGQVQKVLIKLKKKFQKNKIFGLINNAAFNPQPSKNKNKNSLENFKLIYWEREIKVGLTGAFICSKIFGNFFAKNGGGTIINISSDLGIKAPKQSLYSHLNYFKPVTYSVIKHGLHGLTKYICSYWGKSKVRCNTLAPGGVFNNQNKKFVNKLRKEIPMDRMAKLSDFDGIILYLLSDLSSFTNGSLISVDGGRTVI
jgi:NAD(P)-dependent dehydrogenase (short-subunit alcohol dehydrogenase family)